MKKIYMIAGEPSGDFLGAKIMQKVSQIENVKVFGVGGDLMKCAGLDSLINIEQISVGGIAEIVPHIFAIKRLIEYVAENIVETKPDILLTIDSPGFCFRVAKIVRRKDPSIKLVHFVAPSVWAWRPKRAKKLAELYDHLLTLFDFEPPYFTKYGLKTTFVGHPAIDEFEQNNVPKQDLLLVLPGSRKQEVKTLLPIFLETLKYLSFERIVIPTLPNLTNLVSSIAREDNVEIVSNEMQKKELFQRAKCAIVASGTATLQLALSGCPMVCCYKLSPLTYHIVKSLIKTKYISLVNIILDRCVIPELIQNECTPEKIADAVNTLGTQEQTDSFIKLRERLYSDISPSQKIANVLLDYMGSNT